MPTTTIERLVFDLDANVRKFNANMKGAEGKLSGMGKLAAGIGPAIGIGLAVGAAGMVKSIITTSAQFEKGMNAVKAVSGATEEEFQKLRATAKDLGSTTKFTAQEAANGIEMLAKNGLKADQILGGAAKASVELASATGTNLANSADIATDAMSNFNIEAEDMTDAINQISGVTVNSKFDIDDYRLALGQAGGIAGKVGVGFKDFNAALALIAPNFASGSDAGTSFKNFLVRLNPASKEAAEIMDKYGLSFFNAEGDMKSMGEIAENLKEGLGDLSEQAKLEVMQKIFGTDSLRVALAFSEAGEEGIETMKEMVGQTVAADQAKDRMGGLEGVLLKLKSAWEGLKITIGDSGLLDWATDMVTALTDVISWIDKVLQKSDELMSVSLGANPLAGFAQGVNDFLGINQHLNRGADEGGVNISQKATIPSINEGSFPIAQARNVQGSDVSGSSLTSSTMNNQSTGNKTTNNVFINEKVNRSDIAEITQDADRQTNRG